MKFGFSQQFHERRVDDECKNYYGHLTHAVHFLVWGEPLCRKEESETGGQGNKIEMALKEYAEKEPRLKEILKHIGLT